MSKSHSGIRLTSSESESSQYRNCINCPIVASGDAGIDQCTRACQPKSPATLIRAAKIPRARTGAFAIACKLWRIGCGSDTAECLNHFVGASFHGHGVGGNSISSRRQAGSGQILAATLLRGPRHQHCKDDRNENKRRHISHQVPALARILDRLNAHDRRMNHARPDGEPYEALVSIGIS